MRIVFIGAVKFSEQALNKLVEIKSSIVRVCALEYSDFNSDHVDLSPLRRKNLILQRINKKFLSKYHSIVINLEFICWKEPLDRGKQLYILI